jgi:hypothetical protein
MNAIIIQQVYPERGFEPLLDLTKAHHKAYCQQHNFDYQAEYSDVYEHDPVLGSYAKIELIKRAMLEGYEYVVWLDADTLILDTATDLRKAIERNKIGVCWHRLPQLNHWNVGALYIHNSAETFAFIDEWLSVYPPPKDGWNEQGVFNRMAIKRNVVVTLSDKWNSTIMVNEVPDAVVLGFHGQPKRLELMRDVFYKLFPEQEAKTQGMSEVT